MASLLGLHGFLWISAPQLCKCLMEHSIVGGTGHKLPSVDSHHIVLPSFAIWIKHVYKMGKACVCVCVCVGGLLHVNWRWLNKACGWSERSESSRGLPFALVGDGDAPPALHSLDHWRLPQLRLQALPAAARQVGRCPGERGGVRHGDNRPPPSGTLHYWSASHSRNTLLTEYIYIYLCKKLHTNTVDTSLF